MAECLQLIVYRTNKVKIVYPLHVQINVCIKSTLSQRAAVQTVPLILWNVSHETSGKQLLVERQGLWQLNHIIICHCSSSPFLVLSLLLVLLALTEQNDQLAGVLQPIATAAPCYHASITSVGLAPAQPITCTLQHYPVFLIQQKYNVTLLPSSRFNWHADTHNIIMLADVLFVAVILQILMCV